MYHLRDRTRAWLGESLGVNIGDFCKGVNIKDISRRAKRGDTGEFEALKCVSMHLGAWIPFPFFFNIRNLPLVLPLRIWLGASDFRSDYCRVPSRGHFQKLESQTQDGKVFNRRSLRGSSVCWLVGCRERGCVFAFFLKLRFRSSSENPTNPM